MSKYVNVDKLYKSFGITGDCDTCKEKYDCEMSKSQYDLGDICCHIEYADAIEVVRCKECHYNAEGDWLSCPMGLLYTDDDFFCKAGERK